MQSTYYQKIGVVFFCLLIFVATFCTAQKVPLFNGKDLSGWTVNGTEKWYRKRRTGIGKYSDKVYGSINR